MGRLGNHSMIKRWCSKSSLQKINVSSIEVLCKIAEIFIVKFLYQNICESWLNLNQWLWTIIDFSIFCSNISSQFFPEMAHFIHVLSVSLQVFFLWWLFHMSHTGAIKNNATIEMKCFAHLYVSLQFYISQNHALKIAAFVPCRPSVLCSIKMAF